MTDLPGKAIEAEARRLRAAGAFGRSPPLIALFDYLLEQSLAGRAPKEDEIATAVFNRDPGFDRGQDSVVRVYAHRLRRALESAYGKVEEGTCRLELPRGEYRLRIAAAPEPAIEKRLSWRDRLVRFTPAAIVAVMATVALLSGFTAFALARLTDGPSERIAAARANVLWQPLLDNGMPTLVVLGDYYMMGESDDGMNVSRLVREFDVNGPADLDAQYMFNPAQAQRYIDIGMRYLPTAAAPALGRIMPVLGRMSGTDGVTIILASDLTPAMLKTSNVVFLGYFSAMGSALQNARAGSRFAIGASYDEVVDRRTGRRHVSQAGFAAARDTYSDYGLISSFRGPAGNVIVLIAGTRDTAVQQMSEIATEQATMARAWRAAGEPAAFEALYDVSVMGRTDVTGRLIAASPIDSARIWQVGEAGEAPGSEPPG